VRDSWSKLVRDAHAKHRIFALTTKEITAIVTKSSRFGCRALPIRRLGRPAKVAKADRMRILRRSEVRQKSIYPT
jgi:hypothetical protein